MPLSAQKSEQKTLIVCVVYENLHISWALSLFGFVTVALLPIPWMFYKFGPQLRAKSKYPTHDYEN